jgi:hypothetical protein
VDVGEGVGSLLVSILAKQQGFRGVLIEQPEVLTKPIAYCPKAVPGNGASF